MTDLPVPNDLVPPSSAAPKRRWVRRLLLSTGVAVGGVVLLVAIAPTLLSTGPFVRFALRQVDARLNGRVEVASVSLGWLSGVRVDGLRVFDEAGVQVAQADHVACPMGLWRTVTGRYPLGHTVVDGLAFDARVDAQGRLNFAQLVKTNPSEPKPPAAPPRGAPPAAPSKLPDVSGDLELTHARGTVSQAGRPTLYLTRLAAEVRIPTINDPITNHLDATVRAGEGGPDGHLVVDGTAAAIKANLLDVDTATVHQTAELTSLDLAAAKPFVPASVGLDTLAGLLNGHLSADVTNGRSAVVDGALTATQKVVIGGRVLKGDTFSTDTLVAAIPKLSAAFPDGLAHWQSGRVQVGAEAGSQPILFKVDQGQLSLVVDVVPQAVLNLGASAAPGTDGRIEFADHFEVGKIVDQLKGSTHLSNDATLTGGTLDQSFNLTLTPARGTLTASSDLAGVAGTRNGKPVSVQPVHLALAGADVGGRSLLDGLRDLSLTLSSKFANADFKGSTVGDLNGSLTAQLQSLQAEAAQLVDFGKVQLAGDVTAHIANRGQLMQAPYRAQVQADATVTDLRYGDPAAPRVAEPLVRFSVTGDLQGSATAAVEGVKDLLVSLQAGTAESPTIDLVASVPSATLGTATAADFRVTRFMVNLPQLQQQFARVPPGQSGLVLAGGSATANASGHYGPDGLRLNPSYLSFVSVFLQKQLATGQRVNAISGDTINLSVAGTVGLGEATTVDLTQLSVADTAHIVDIHKGDGELALTRRADAVAGRGQLAVMLELGSVNDILRLLMQETVTVPTPAGRLKTGHLTGTLAFAAAASGKTDITADFDVPNLDVATGTGDTGPQKASFVVRASSDQSAHTIVADELSFKSPFATAAVTNLSLLLSAPSTLDQLRKGTLAVDVPDLKTLFAVAQSFSAPAAVDPAAPPLRFTGGSLSVRAGVSHDGNNLLVDVPTLAATGVAFTRGTASYQAKPVTMKLAATIGTAEGTSLMGQLRGLKVTELAGNAGVATVSMPTPITVADLSNPAASAAGGIRVDGELADLAQLAAAFEGKPVDAYPYRGHLTLAEDVTGGPGITLKGGVDVAQFQLVQGETVRFAEDRLAATNDVSMAADLNSVTLHNVALAMQSSGALNASITDGTVTDLAAGRHLHLPVQLTYDLAKLWPLVHPMLLTPGQPDAYADVKLSGAFTKSLLVGGNYPAGKPMTEAIKPLQLDADLAVADFEHAGLVVKDFDVPVTLRDGRAVTAYPDGHVAPVATANDGQLDLGHLTVDLTTDPPRLSTSAAKVVLSKVTINPLFTQGFLGKIVNNPVFVGAQQASGLVDLSFDSCDRLPLGDLVKRAVPANDGSAHVRFSMSNVHIGIPSLSLLSSALNSDNFETHVTDATVVVAGGMETQRIAFVSGPYTIGVNGTVRLADDAMVPMTVTLPITVLLAKQGAIDPNIRKYLPDEVPITLRGTTDDVSLDTDAVTGQLIRDASTKALQGGLGNLLGGGASTQPANQGGGLGNLLNGLGKKRKKK